MQLYTKTPILRNSIKYIYTPHRHHIVQSLSIYPFASDNTSSHRRQYIVPPAPQRGVKTVTVISPPVFRFDYRRACSRSAIQTSLTLLSLNCKICTIRLATGVVHSCEAWFFLSYAAFVVYPSQYHSFGTAILVLQYSSTCMAVLHVWW